MSKHYETQKGKAIGPYLVHSELAPKKPVYFGKHQNTGREVVIKGAEPMVLAEDQSPKAIGELCLEYEHSLQSRLKHPNICPVEGPIIEHDGAHYLVTPLVGKNDFVNFVKNYNPTRTERLKVLEDIAQALVYCHSKNIVHLDMKAENVVVDDGRGKLIDFGSARELNKSHEIVDAIVSCTLSCVAPEYFRDHVFTKRTDTFSFAVMGYWALTGNNAFKRLGIQLWYEQPKYVPKRMEEYGSLGKLIITGLKLRQTERPDMTEIAGALKELTAKPRLQPNGDSLILSPASA